MADMFVKRGANTIFRLLRQIQTRRRVSVKERLVMKADGSTLEDGVELDCGNFPWVQPKMSS